VPFQIQALASLLFPVRENFDQPLVMQDTHSREDAHPTVPMRRAPSCLHCVQLTAHVAHECRWQLPMIMPLSGYVTHG
jgi:hypothetical protein